MWDWQLLWELYQDTHMNADWYDFEAVYFPDDVDDESEEDW